MKRELVLDANGKQERFKKFLRKKEDERKKADEDQSTSLGAIPPLQPIQRMPGYQINALLHLQQQARNNYQMPFSFPDPSPRFTPSPPRTSHIYPPFPFGVAPKQPSLSSTIIPDNVKLTTQMLSDLQSKISGHSPALYHGHKSPVPQYRQEQPYGLAITSLLNRGSIIASPASFQDKEEMTSIQERGSSEEEEGAGASSSKRQYFLQAPQQGSPLPLQVQIKEEITTEEEDDPEERTEQGLLDKYIHKKFSKAKTFSSVCCVPMENLKRRSVIVQAPPAKKGCSTDLRLYRISRPDLREDAGRRDEVEEQQTLTTEEVLAQAEYEDGEAPVDLSRSSPLSRSTCTSSYGSSPR